MVKPAISPTGKPWTTSGFTLLELLVVLVLLGLVAALALPALGRLVPGVETKSAASTVAAAFREGRSLAIQLGEEVAVTLDVGQRTLRIGNRSQPILLPERLSVSLLTGRSEIVGEGQGQISFFPDGTSTGGAVGLTDGARQFDVTVDWLTGRVVVDE